MVSHEVIISLISSTRTGKGLIVRCELDKNKYPKGIKVSDEELFDFHGEWNYTIKPNTPHSVTVI